MKRYNFEVQIAPGVISRHWVKASSPKEAQRLAEDLWADQGAVTYAPRKRTHRVGKPSPLQLLLFDLDLV